MPLAVPSTPARSRGPLPLFVRADHTQPPDGGPRPRTRTCVRLSVAYTSVRQRPSLPDALGTAGPRFRRNERRGAGRTIGRVVALPFEARGLDRTTPIRVRTRPAASRGPPRMSAANRLNELRTFDREPALELPPIAATEILARSSRELVHDVLPSIVAAPHQGGPVAVCPPPPHTDGVCCWLCRSKNHNPRAGRRVYGGVGKFSAHLRRIHGPRAQRRFRESRKLRRASSSPPVGDKASTRSVAGRTRGD